MKHLFTSSFKLFTFLFFLNNNLAAQLDTIHYLPPMHSRDASQVDDHYIYLTTLESGFFNVTITTPSGTPIAVVPLSRNNPYRFTIASNDPSYIMVPRDSLLTVLKECGFKLSAPFPFFANFRARSGSQAELITCKGNAAFGRTFRAGVAPQQASTNTWRSFFVSFIALENNTTVTVSDYDNGVTFAGPGTSTVSTPTHTVVLNKGESYVISGYTDVPINDTGFVGALISSTKDIVVNNGNWLGSIYTGSGGQDIMADQAVPVNWIGTEYVLIEGDGLAQMEMPLVIAHYDNTDIYVAGAYVTTINAGDYYLINNTGYAGTTHQNMYVKTSKPVYMYQPLGGSAAGQTPGMNFIPPLSCFFPKEVVIPAVDSIGSIKYSGAILVLTIDTATLKVNGVTQTLKETVVALPGWVTYKVTGFSGKVEVESTGPSAIGLFGYSGAAGFAGYFSGFGAKATELFTEFCPGDADITLTAEEGFSYEWKNQNGELLGTTQTVVIPNPKLGDEYTVYMSNGPSCSLQKTVKLEFNPPSDLPNYLVQQNVLTPNGDGFNDKFITSMQVDYTTNPPTKTEMLYVKSFNLNIYDRWGKLVFTSNDPMIEWDGILSNGQKAEDGTYFWHLTYISKCVLEPDATPFTGKGFITVISK